LNFIYFFKKLFDAIHSYFPIVSGHAISWCPFLKDTTIIHRQIFGLGNRIPIASKSKFWAFHRLKNLSLTWITKCEYKDKVGSNILVKKVHNVLKNIFLKLSYPSCGGLHHKKNVMNRIKIFLKFLSNHLNDLLIFANSSSISESRSIDKPIYSLTIFVLEVVISDWRGDRPGLTFNILYNNIISKIILKLNTCYVVNDRI
jgi:hypothetical protein